MNFSLRVSRRSFFLFLAFCLWIVPTYLYNVSAFMFISNMFGYLTIFAFLIELIFKKKRPSAIFWLIVVCFVIQGIGTAIENPDLLWTYVRQYAKTTAICFYIDDMMRGEQCDKDLNVLLHYLEFMIIVNLLTIIIFPDGMYVSGNYTTNYWMGYGNTHIRWQLVALALSYIYTFSTKRRITLRPIILTVVVFISNILVDSSTATIAMIVFVIGILYILFNKRKDKEKGIKIFNPLCALIVSIVGTIVVVGGTILGQQINLISNIASFFGRDGATLTGRDIIWVNSLAAINAKPILGYGYETSDMISMRLVSTTGYGTNPHNFCLEILYYGGILLAVTVVIIYIAMHINLRKYKNSPIVAVCGLWLLIVAVMGLTEPQYITQLRFAWIIIWNIPIFLQKTEMLQTG